MKRDYTKILLSIIHIILNFVLEILKDIWQIFLIKLIKISIISLCIWGLLQLIPNNLDYLQSISYLSWCLIIILYNLVTYKYDDSIETNNEENLPDAEFSQTTLDDLPERETDYGSTRE